MEMKLNHLIILILLGITKSQKCKLTFNEINCSGKKIETIPKFQKSWMIETLDMSDNELEELFKVDFYNYSSLKRLRLNYNNIFYVEDNTFENLYQLEVLDLSENVLEEIPDEVISTNKKIISLDLSKNLFNARTPCLYSASLEKLDLSQSKITYFKEENIAGLVNLKILNLSSNNLITINPDIFKIPKSFSTVDLYSNTWECSCETIKIFKRLEFEKRFTITKDIKCFRANKIEYIYGKNGSTSRWLDCDDSLINGIKSLEEILKMEKIYYQELRKEKEVLVSVTSLTMKILIVVIFFVGISLGILISTIMDKRINRIRRLGIYRQDSLT